MALRKYACKNSSPKNIILCIFRRWTSGAHCVGQRGGAKTGLNDQVQQICVPVPAPSPGKNSSRKGPLWLAKAVLAKREEEDWVAAQPVGHPTSPPRQ